MYVDTSDGAEERDKSEHHRLQKAELAFYKDKSMNKCYTGERIKNGKELFFSPGKRGVSIFTSLDLHNLFLKE